MDRRYEEHEVETISAALYDGGWRAEDKDILKGYGFTEEQVDQICKKLQEFAK